MDHFLGQYDEFQLLLLAGATFLAATVRGFSGFGSGLVYLPLAAQVLTPFQALTTIVIFDLIGPIPILRKASHDCDKSDLIRLITGLVIALPLGLFLLTMIPAEVFRYTVSFVALFLLTCLALGLRYHGNLNPPLIFGTGALSGFSQGIAGLPGPPVILLYMASTKPVRVIRANILLFLYTTDIALIAGLAAFDRLDSESILLGVLLIVPNLIGSLLGAKLFIPKYEKVYRTVAYLIITVSAITTMPIWD